MMVLLITYIVSGLLMVGLGMPLIQHRIKPNGWFGFRTRKTLQHEDLWYAVNAYSGRMLMWTGIAVAAASLALYPFDLSEDAYSLLVLLVMFVGIFWMLWQAFGMIRRYEVE